MHQTFPCTPTQFANLGKQLVAQGVSVPSGNTGTITGHGITAPFVYDGTANLSVIIQDKPWYIPASTIFGEIQSHLNAVT